jgi:hypothetical protein
VNDKDLKVEIERLRNDRDRWRELAKAIVRAVAEDSSVSTHKKQWPALWSAIEATMAHVSTLREVETTDAAPAK